ncbi:hypothetical protein ALQ71_02961 [Pseudomonas coronafaciens pv. striafaciens]|uniref:helix-turn-helix domain-containing protein n=1 Tax=Pseudomonas coronafaciens TaxID=53409 RepID=UPI000F00928E|nr:helix-turn-helix domain-containing protein [Pseudomonas coronafaciens]RMM84579.1 hypothetical protein ALQ71_02961 [Pseudomonas coronafaciens pv. striafaciens]
MKNYLLRLLAPSTKHEDFAAMAANAMEELAENLEEAIYSQDRTEIETLSKMLMELSSSVVRKLPPAAKAIVSGSANQATEFDHLYVVGQLAFAQHLAAVIASKRPHKSFVELLDSDWAGAYLDALHAEPLSSSELATKIGVSKESVSRNLRRLREAGIADFKKKGAFTINYLTSAAFEVWSAVVSEKPTTKIEALRSERSRIEDGTTHPHTSDTVKGLLERMKNSSQEHMHKMPIMDAPA